MYEIQESDEEEEYESESSIETDEIEQSSSSDTGRRTDNRGSIQQFGSKKSSLKKSIQKRIRKFTERQSILYTDPNKYYQLAHQKQQTEYDQDRKGSDAKNRSSKMVTSLGTHFQKMMGKAKDREPSFGSNPSKRDSSRKSSFELRPG